MRLKAYQWNSEYAYFVWYITNYSMDLDILPNYQIYPLSDFYNEALF